MEDVIRAKKVEAQLFSLVDTTGTERCSIGTCATGQDGLSAVFVHLNDPTEVPRLSMTVDRTEATLLLMDQNSVNAITVKCGNFGSSIQIKDREGRIRCQVLCESRNDDMQIIVRNIEGHIVSSIPPKTVTEFPKSNAPAD